MTKKLPKNCYAPTPTQRIKALALELADTKLKAQLFEAMLNVIQSESGIKLPKKTFQRGLPKKKLFDDRWV